MLSATAILKISCLRNILVSTSSWFLDDNELHMSRGQESEFHLTTSSEKAVFRSLQKKEWFQSPRPLDPWDSWGSNLFQMPVPQRIGSFMLLLCPFPAETMKPFCTYAKKHVKYEDHTDAAAQSLLHWQGQYLVQLILWSNWKKLVSDLSYLFCTAGIIFSEAGNSLETSSIQSQPHKDVHLK